MASSVGQRFEKEMARLQIIELGFERSKLELRETFTQWMLIVSSLMKGDMSRSKHEDCEEYILELDAFFVGQYPQMLIFLKNVRAWSHQTKTNSPPSLMKVFAREQFQAIKEERRSGRDSRSGSHGGPS